MQPYFKPKFVLKNFNVHNELELEPGLPDNVPAKVIVIKMLLNSKSSCDMSEERVCDIALGQK